MLGKKTLYLYIINTKKIYMLIIKIGKNESIERALKRYKRKVRNVKQSQQIRDNRYYTKPSASKRRQKSKAVYLQQKRDNEQD
jgi:small subunit ribosomal protein S21